MRGIGKLDCPVRIPMALGPYHVTSPLQLSKQQLPGPGTGSLGVFHSPGQCPLRLLGAASLHQLALIWQLFPGLSKNLGALSQAGGP